MKIKFLYSIQIIFYSLFIFIGCKRNDFSAFENSKLNDSVTIYIAKSNETTFSKDEKISFIKKAYELTLSIENENLRLDNLNIISNAYLKLNCLQDYKFISLESLKLSRIINDSLNTAKQYWKLGYFYQQKFNNDSAFIYYNKAYIVYNKLNSEAFEGAMLLNIATIKEDLKDYTGSEISSIKAISKLEKSQEYRSLYLAHNNLGIVYKNLNNYEQALKHNYIALEYLKKFKPNENFMATTFNNIGRTYVKNGEYLKSLQNYEKAEDIDNLFEISPLLYAMIIDNLAYSKFKIGQITELPELFYKALKIRDSLNIKDGQVESNLHLSEYYLSLKDSLKAINYAEKAYIISKEFNYNDGLLESYILLSKIESPKKGIEYLQKHIKLSDSLQQQEREIREKFTRIAYETDEITKENKVITKKNWWLTIAIIIGGGFFTVVYFYIRQRSKNKELLFNQKQEEANTEIYNLMISEKAKFQEGSVKERNRISEELHDNVVNKLFGTRLGLLVLNDKNTKEAINKREHHIETLQQIEEEIRTVSHELKVEKFNLDNTFEKMVEDLLIKQSKLTNFEWKLSFSEVISWENISNKIKIHCYRTLQETLHNIHKYAKATEVEIKFFDDEKVLLVEIIDNGVGFNPSTKTNGIGLQNIKSRIAKLKGKVEIISTPGYGTKIRLKIPLCSKS